MVKNRTTLENAYYASQHSEATKLEELIDNRLEAEWIPGGLINIPLNSLPTLTVQDHLNKKYNPCGFKLEFSYNTQYNQCEYYVRVTAVE